jgi:hypothetical protein
MVEYDQPAMRGANEHPVAGAFYRQDSVIQRNLFRAGESFETGSEKSRPEGVIYAHALSSAYPDAVLVVGIDAIDVVIQEGGGIADRISENAKGVPVIPVQPVIGAEPHETIAILVNAGYGIVRKALVDTQVSYG